MLTLYPSLYRPMEADKDKHHPAYWASQGRLLSTAQPNPNLAAKNRNLDKEQSDWEAKYGEDVPLMKEMLELAMPHYSYLYEKRLKF